MKIKQNLIFLLFLIIIFFLIWYNTYTENLNELNLNIYYSIIKLLNTKLTLVMIIITSFGDWYFYVPLIVFLLLNKKTRKYYGISLLIMLLSSYFLNELLKQIFAIERPNINQLVHVSGYGFPSGHAMVSFSVYGLLFFLVLNKYKKTKFTYLIFVSISIIVFLIGFSRIYLGVHSFTDVFCGFLMGGILLLTTIVFREKLFNI